MLFSDKPLGEKPKGTIAGTFNIFLSSPLSIDASDSPLKMHNETAIHFGVNARDRVTNTIR